MGTIADSIQKPAGARAFVAAWERGSDGPAPESGEGLIA
jgi:hypothetical protein